MVHTRRPNPVSDCPLTDDGRILLPLVESVRSWGRAHIDRSNEA